MFAPAYFAPEYFAPRYFPPDFEEVVAAGQNGGPGYYRTGRILRYFPEVRKELKELVEAQAEPTVTAELLEAAIGAIVKRLARVEEEKALTLARATADEGLKLAWLSFEVSYLRHLLWNYDDLVVILLAATL